MHEQCKEQRPLLCEDLTDEETNPHYQRSYRPVRGRAKAQVQGAAAIISNWPDHWISSVSNWWMVLGMFALSIFIVYNSVLAFSILPQVHTRPSKMKTISKLASIDLQSKNNLPQVFVHTMIEADEVKENKYKEYLHLIDPITYTYPEFIYNFYVILNDTGTTPKNDYENNEIALDSLWNKPIKRNNVLIHNIRLSNLMYKSPITKNWQDFPKQFMDLLIRAVLIWEKGGIALSPQVFNTTAAYNGILNDVLKTFAICNNTKIAKPIKKVNEYKQKKIVNNIQDIIDMLERENYIDTSAPYSPTEAENKNSITVTRNSRQLLSAEAITNKNELPIKTNENYLTEVNEAYSNNKLNLPVLYNPDTNKSISIVENGISPPEYNKTKLNLLPLFLSFLFHDKDKIDKENTTTNSRHRKSIVDIDNIKTSQIADLNKTRLLKHVKNNNKQDMKPMIVPGKEINYDIIPKTETKDIVSPFNVENLIIDIKGNIFATRTPCHAFLGTLFQSSGHHLDSTETVHNFLITELTHFCKGLLSSCRGIDVILV